MKKIFLVLSLVLSSSFFTYSHAQTISPTPVINPSGYYSMDSKTTSKDGDTYGYFGTLKVKQVDSSRIFVDLYVCKGAPSYNSGTLQDTLLYKNGIAVHTTPDDNTCVITFNFNTAGGVRIGEKTKDTATRCGFGQAVQASGFFRRIVSEGGKK